MRRCACVQNYHVIRMNTRTLTVKTEELETKTKIRRKGLQTKFGSGHSCARTVNQNGKSIKTKLRKMSSED